MKIVSLSFFRHHRSNYELPECGENRGIFFSNFFHSLVHAHWAVWGSDWWLQVAHDDRVKETRAFRFLKELERNSLVRLRDCGTAKTLCGSMLWRMDAIYEEGAEVVVVRDIDSLPMHRDRKMVEHFMGSRGQIHGINDSESHSIPLLGGMIAVKVEGFRAHFERKSWENIKDAFDLREHGSDQKLLNQFVYPVMQDELVIHSRRQTVPYRCLRSYPALPEITPLDNVVAHIGAGYDTQKALRILENSVYPNKALIEECWKASE